MAICGYGDIHAADHKDIRMSPDALFVLLAASTFTLATAWAAWVSKTLVSMMTLLQQTEGRIDLLAAELVTIETDVADHEVRLRAIEH